MSKRTFNPAAILLLATVVVLSTGAAAIAQEDIWQGWRIASRSDYNQLILEPGGGGKWILRITGEGAKRDGFDGCYFEFANLANATTVYNMIRDGKFNWITYHKYESSRTFYGGPYMPEGVKYAKILQFSYSTVN